MKNKKVLVIAAVAVVLVIAVVLAVVLLGGKKEYKLGMGVAFGDFAKDQIGATVATVVTDKDGKIVLCRIDTVQNKYSAGETGISFTNLKTKMELGNDYNMAKYGHSLVGNATVKEWFEQAKAFEAWVVGKTADEVKNMKLQTMENGYVIADESDLLAAGCTISIEEFRDAVVKACNDEQGTTFEAKKDSFTLGVAANSADNGSALVEEGGYKVKMNVDFAASVVADGKILASLNDAMQPEVVVDAEGNVTSKSVGKGEGILKTKRELKEDYKMAAFGTSLVGNAKATEWYIQSAAFSAHIAGMTADQVKGMPTKTMDNGYVISGDQTLINAGCTMQITGIQAVVVKSVTNAR